MNAPTYLLAGQESELERLQLQSRVWEPSGRRLLDEIGAGRGARAVDVGCGVLGWLRLLSEWVGPDGEVVGTDIDEGMLAAAGRFVADEGLGNVVLRNDDLFATGLEPASFDVVHARFVLTPLGRGPVQVQTYLRLLRPGGTVVLEDPDWGSWHFNPPAQAGEQLIALISAGLRPLGRRRSRPHAPRDAAPLRYHGPRARRGLGAPARPSLPAYAAAARHGLAGSVAGVRRRR